MTDDTTDPTGASTRTKEPDGGASNDRDDDRWGEDGPRDPTGGGWSDAGLYERLQWVALVVLVLVAVATLFSFYTNVTRFIAIWASRKYEPAIQAAFALAVLASSLAGIAALSRTLRR